MPPTTADAALYAAAATPSFYDLLSLPATETSPSALRKAFRKSSLKWHPDKNPDPSAPEQFHQLTIAYDVLSDPATRAAYDAALAARAARKRRTDAFDVTRRRMQEDLEGREQGAKRARAEADEAELALERLRAEGAGLRRRREQAVRAARAQQEEAGEEVAEVQEEKTRFTEVDRTLKVRWRRRGDDAVTPESLGALFGRFGRVQDVVVPPARERDGGGGGGKEKRYRTALVVLESVVAAHAAVCEAKEGAEFAAFKDVAWAAGKEPDLGLNKEAERSKGKAAPRFASFGGGGGAPAAAQGTDYESITLMRMRAAEKARIEAEMRREDEEAEKAAEEGAS